MRAGRLKTRRYKTHPLRGVALLLTGVLLGAGALAYGRGGIALPLSAKASASPTPGVREEITFTLPSQSWYALQLGAFDAQSDAEALADGFRSRGAAGYVLKSGQYLVLAAAYPARADAQRVQTQLKSQHAVESFVKEITRPEVTFRLAGNKENLDALRDALDALQGAAEHLSALSVALDQGRGSGEQTLAALRSEKSTVSALKERLQALFPKAAHPAVDDVIGILDALDAALDSAVNVAAHSQLGARIKYCQLLCVCRLSAFAQAQE